MPEDIALENRLRRVFSRLSPADLTEGLDDGAINFDSIFGGEPSPLFLDFYTSEGILNALEAYGAFDLLEKAGVHSPKVVIDREMTGLSVLKLFDADAPTPIVHIALERTYSILPVVGEIPVLRIGWLELRHPRRHFSDERPPLPGQRSPGLGIGWPIFGLLKRLCERLKLQAMMTGPAYLHNAYLYAPEFDCIDPADQGRMLAMIRDIPVRCFGSIAYASWALCLDEVVEVEKDGTKQAKWFEPMMVCACGSSLLVDYFKSYNYLRLVNDAMCDVEYNVDLHKLSAHLRNKGIAPLDEQKLIQTLDFFGWE